MKQRCYSVGAHLFNITMPEPDPLWPMLGSYVPFECATVADGLLFSLVTDERATVPSAHETFAGSFGMEGSLMDVYRDGEAGYAFYLAAPGETIASRVYMSRGYRNVTIALGGRDVSRFFALNNALMLAYAFASAPHDTLLMHASVIDCNGSGFLFLGKSGTGKSTHSRLWLENIEGCRLLNDDNPVLRIIDGIPYVFGSPWSGKTPCYKSDSVSVKGIVKLRQAPQNRIEKLSPLKAYAAVLPACSCMKWEEDVMGGVHATVEHLSTTTGCYQLECLPDREAALLCHSTVNMTE